jgi:putative ABC transport system ATP-binding protein
VEAIVDIKDLHKRYRLGRDNYVEALRGATLSVRAGEVAAIMGPSGSGKSTLMHIAGGLDEADSGEVLLEGVRLDGLSGKALADVRGKRVGFVFQGFNLIPTMKAVENVALAAEYAGKGRREAARAAGAVLELVGLGDRMEHLPTELSGGQQQRVAVARALVNEPRIVMGDEPTGDLDTATSQEIIQVMRTINAENGTTFLIVTHDPEVAQACDRIIHVRDGVVEEEPAAV